MRTRLARLLRAAARRLDPPPEPWIPAETWDRAAVVQSAFSRALGLGPDTKVQWCDPVPRTELDLEQFRAEVDRMAGVIARSQDLPENVFRRPRPSGGAILGPPSRPADSVPAKLSEGGPVTGFGDDDLAFRKGQAVRIELPGQEPVYRRVQSVERLPGGTIVTHFEPHEL